MSAITGKPVVGGTYPVYITENATLIANQYDRVVALLEDEAATLTLPALATCPNGYELLIRNNSADALDLTVKGNGSELIGGSNTATLNQNESLRILVDHVRTKWQILFGPA